VQRATDDVRPFNNGQVSFEEHCSSARFSHTRLGSEHYSWAITCWSDLGELGLQEPSFLTVCWRDVEGVSPHLLFCRQNPSEAPGSKIALLEVDLMIIVVLERLVTAGTLKTGPVREGTEDASQAPQDHSSQGMITASLIFLQDKKGCSMG